MSNYDYQLSKARRSFGDEVLDLNYGVVKGRQVPLETEPVACDNNTSSTLKPGH